MARIEAKCLFDGVSPFLVRDAGKVGDEVEAGEVFADVESVKAVSDIYSPVTGTVAEINEELLDAPEKINEDAYGAWVIKVENISEQADDLMDEDAYKAYCDEASAE